MSHDDVLTIGIMNAGKAHNIIPEKAYMKCSLRSYRPDDQEYIMGRVNELVQSIASMYHAQAGIKFYSRHQVSIMILHYLNLLWM